MPALWLSRFSPSIVGLLYTVNSSSLVCNRGLIPAWPLYYLFRRGRLGFLVKVAEANESAESDVHNLPKSGARTTLRCTLVALAAESGHDHSNRRIRPSSAAGSSVTSAEAFGAEARVVDWARLRRCQRDA